VWWGGGGVFFVFCGFFCSLFPFVFFLFFIFVFFCFFCMCCAHLRISIRNDVGLLSRSTFDGAHTTTQSSPNLAQQGRGRDAMLAGAVSAMDLRFLPILRATMICRAHLEPCASAL